MPSSSEQSAGSMPNRLTRNYFLFTAMISGAMVMVLEVIGSRVIGPYFGASLFVWTSLISVTLLALALGYAVGGWLIDRHQSATVLYLTLLLAGCITLLIPLVKIAVIKLCLPLGLRAGSFASAFVLFGPSLFLLGCVSPQLAKVATREMSQLGRTVGGLYALSTIGSVVGTLLTGFVLITLIGIDETFQLVGGILLLLSAVYFVVFRRRYLAMLILLVPLVTPDPAYSNNLVMPNGTAVALIDQAESFYGSVKVVEYRGERLRTRELIIDGLIQGGVDASNGQSVYEYPYLMQFLPYALNPDGERALVIGLGAGVIPRWYEAQGIPTDVVDIDPVVLAMANKHFGFTLEGDMYIEDARYYLSTSDQNYDYLLLDVFSGDTTPGYLLSLEAVQLIRQRMTSNGILAINLVADLAQERRATQAIVATIARQFRSISIYPVFEFQRETKTVGNVVIIAHNMDAREPDHALIQHQPVHPWASRLVSHALHNRLPYATRDESLILTDNFNPLDVIDTQTKESVRNAILASTNWEILGASK
jgi:spermidine synthase